MNRLACLLLLGILPVPYDGPYFARRPLQPYPGVIPAHPVPAVEAGRQQGKGYWTEPGQVWRGDPGRPTKFWRDGACKMCDDPDCWLCSEHVYEQAEEVP